MTARVLPELRQHEIIILRRLRTGPLTEFELAREVSENSNWTAERAFSNIVGWLESLQRDGLVWAGKLYNQENQHIFAAALTRKGQEMVR